MLEHKNNFQTESMMKHLLKENDLLILILMLKKIALLKEHIPLQKKSVVSSKNDIQLKFHRLYFYDEFQWNTNHRKK